MSSTDIQEGMIRIFESVRQTPADPYDPDRLLAYLTSPPAPTGRSVADTFAGRRRFLRFMDAVQMEFGVCFTIEEWEQGFRLSGLVDGVEAKLRRPEQQKRLAEKRARTARAMRFSEPVKFGVASGLLLSAPILYGPFLLQLLVGALWMTIVVVTTNLSLREYSYAQRLVARIERADG